MHFYMLTTIKISSMIHLTNDINIPILNGNSLNLLIINSILHQEIIEQEVLKDLFNFRNESGIFESFACRQKCEKSHSHKKRVHFTKTDHKAIRDAKSLRNISCISTDEFIKDLIEIFNNHTLDIQLKNRFKKPFMTTEILKQMKIRSSSTRIILNNGVQQ